MLSVGCTSPVNLNSFGKENRYASKVEAAQLSHRQAWSFHWKEADRQTDWRRMPCESLVATSDLRVGLKTRDENYTRKHNSEDLPEARRSVEDLGGF